MKIKVSVIVPVFKVERYIERCIHSLLDQTLSEIELIVVDDRGLDRSIEIVEHIQQNHIKGSFIQIIQMPSNSGAALSRNEALKIAKGEYVSFVDSDDWCEPVMYEELYNEAVNTNSDWCYCQAIKDFSSKKSKLLKQVSLPSGELNAEKRSIMLTQFVSYFWAGIYRTDFLRVNNIRFPQGKFSEDSYFLWLVILQISSYSSIEKPFYHYIVHPTSVSNIADNKKSIRKIELYNSLLIDLKERKLYVAFKDEIDFLYIKKGFLLPLLIYIIESATVSSVVIKSMYNELNSQIPDFKSNRYLMKHLQVRLLITLFNCVPTIMIIFFRLSFIKNKIEL